MATSRYTPPVGRRWLVRPWWHKAIGGTSIVGGVALFVICRFNGWGIHDYGGHIWYLVGLVIAASSLWWCGAMDRPPARP